MYRLDRQVTASNLSHSVDNLRGGLDFGLESYIVMRRILSTKAKVADIRSKTTAR